MANPHDKKRRAARLEAEAGTAQADPELRAMTDEQVLAEYERELSGEAAREREHEATERADPVFGYLKAVDDDALIAQYEAATTALAEEIRTKSDAALVVMLRRARGEGLVTAQIKAEIERRRPKPEPAPVSEPEPIEPHPVALVPTSHAPAPPPVVPGAHYAVPVEDCACFLCAAHREAAREEAELRAVEEKYADAPLVEGSVILAPNTSPEVAAALRGVQQR